MIPLSSARRLLGGRLLAWQLLGPVCSCLLLACSPDSGQQAAATAPALPTGHYEGVVTYQETELPVALDLREISPGAWKPSFGFRRMKG